MSTSRNLALIILTVCSFGCLAAEDGVYRRFLSLVDTNDARPQGISSPSLVDTNNRLRKITGPVLSVEKLKQEDRVGGIQLGMTMGQVVAAWGKPVCIWSHCLDRLPSFSYSGTMLGFKGNSLKVIHFSADLGVGTRFENGLSIEAPINDWIRVLGEPTARKGSDKGGLLIYAGPKATMTLQFHDGELDTIRLEQPQRAAQLKE